MQKTSICHLTTPVEHYNGFQIFVDEDQNRETGYVINGIGARLFLKNRYARISTRDQAVIGNGNQQHLLISL